MTGQVLYQKVHNSVCREEPMFIRALQGHTGKNLDVSLFSRKKRRSHVRPSCFVCTCWFSHVLLALLVIVFHLFLVIVVPKPFGSLRNRAAKL